MQRPFSFRRSVTVLGLCGVLGMPAAVRAAPPIEAKPAPTGTWQAAGTLLESCTCAVPCSCNFGEGPSPHSYCHAVYGYRLEKASWDGVDLSGLVVAGADGPGGAAGYLDIRTTAVQRAALEKMARAVFAQGGPSGGARRFMPIAITHSVMGNHLKLQIGEYGGFSADVIVGRDGKSPVVVENNTIWPIARAIKAKARPLSYKDDGAAGTVRGDGTNANYGAFSFQGKVASFSAAAKSAKPPTKLARSVGGSPKNCCVAER